MVSTLAELWATALTFVIMVVCYFISVVNRNFIKGSMPWTEELALYCMVYMAHDRHRAGSAATARR